LNFGRRISLYLFGFALGGLIVWLGLMKNRPDDALTSWLPSKRIIMQLDTNRQVPSKEAECWMRCRKVTGDDIKKGIKNGDVNYGKSEVHAKPCPQYAIDAVTSKGLHLRFLCAACDGQTNILSITDLNAGKDTCQCK
jgi:hypothetical protein